MKKFRVRFFVENKSLETGEQFLATVITGTVPAIGDKMFIGDILNVAVKEKHGVKSDINLDDINFDEVQVYERYLSYSKDDYDMYDVFVRGTYYAE